MSFFIAAHLPSRRHTSIIIPRGTRAKLAVTFIPDLADMGGILDDLFVNSEKIECIPLEKRTSGLTSQETECLRWCKEGKTNWEIGEILRISEKTVEFHLGNAMRKLGARNRITAVIRGIKDGLIPL